MASKQTEGLKANKTEGLKANRRKASKQTEGLKANKTEGLKANRRKASKQTGGRPQSKQNLEFSRANLRRGAEHPKDFLRRWAPLRGPGARAPNPKCLIYVSKPKEGSGAKRYRRWAALRRPGAQPPKPNKSFFLVGYFEHIKTRMNSLFLLRKEVGTQVTYCEVHRRDVIFR